MVTRYLESSRKEADAVHVEIVKAARARHAGQRMGAAHD